MSRTGPIPSIPAALLVIIAVLLSGVLAVFVMGGLVGVSRYLFIQFDLSGMVIAIALYGLAYVVVLSLPKGVSRTLLGANLARIQVGWIAAATFCVSIAGTHLVYSGYALSMDEWMPRLQAGIFAEGSLTAMIDSEWRPYGAALFHSFATFDEETGRIASSYRPGMASLIAVFDLFGAGIYVSAVLNAGSVLLVARVARQMWPGADPALPVIAAILLATSPQALAASMTSYAMSAHLFLALLWLLLFLHDKLVLHAAAAVVGVLAASLHQVHVHLFFALPFLLILVFRRQVSSLVVYGVIYSVGHVLVIAWDQVLIADVAQRDAEMARTVGDNIAGYFAFPRLSDLASVWANIVRLLVWQNLAVLPAIWVLWHSPRATPTWVKTVLLSIGLSLLPHIFIVPDQGHGWGYRYLHLFLGLFALLGALGWSMLEETQGTRIKLWLSLLVVLTPLMIGLRALQIESFVTPYRLATDLAHEQPVDVVVIDSYRVMVGNDIPRNRPTDLTQPVVMSLHALSVSQIEALCRLYEVSFLSVEDLGPLGLRTFAVDVLPDQDAFARKTTVLQSVECADE